MGGTCSSPMRDRSQTMSRRSAPQEARMVSFLGLHPIWNTSSLWCSNVCSGLRRLRKSCSATCAQAERSAFQKVCAVVLGSRAATNNVPHAALAANLLLHTTKRSLPSCSGSKSHPAKHSCNGAKIL